MNGQANNQWVAGFFRHRKLIELLFFIIAAGIFIFHNIVLPENHRGDLAVFYFAGSTVTGKFHLQPDDLYNTKNRRAILRRLVHPLSGTQFLYPPQSALLSAPLTFIPYRWAEKLWDWFNTIAVIGAYVATIRFLICDRFLRIRYSLVLAFLAFAPPIEKLFYTGQVNGIILFLLIAGMVALLKKRQITSGILIGIAATIKIFPLFFFCILSCENPGRRRLRWRHRSSSFFSARFPCLDGKQ